MDRNTFVYMSIGDVLKGGYGKKYVRVMGSVARVDQIHQTVVLESNKNQIECSLSEEQMNGISNGQYLQILGIVNMVFFIFNSRGYLQFRFPGEL